VREAFDETLSQLRGAVILRHAGETLSAGMVIGHIVVGTSTGMIVAENSCRYLYSSENGEHASWAGMRSERNAELWIDEELLNISLTRFNEDVTVTEDCDDDE
jgi:hypothetical protein